MQIFKVFDSPKGMLKRLPLLTYGLIALGLSYLIHTIGQGATDNFVRPIVEIAPVIGWIGFSISILGVVLKQGTMENKPRK